MKLRGPAAVGINPDHVAGVVGVGAAVFEGFDADAAIEEVLGGAQGGRAGDFDMAGIGEGAATAIVEGQALEGFEDVGDGLGVLAAGRGEAAIGAPVGFGAGRGDQQGGGGEGGEVATHGISRGWGEASTGWGFSRAVRVRSSQDGFRPAPE